MDKRFIVEKTGDSWYHEKPWIVVDKKKDSKVLKHFGTWREGKEFVNFLKRRESLKKLFGYYGVV